MTGRHRQFRDLRRGDVIICPYDGYDDTVIAAESNRHGSIFVETDRHDHLRRPDADVTILTRDGTAR
jgi:hypothetical protein